MKIIHGFCRDNRKSIVNNIKTLVFIAVDGIALLVVFMDVYTIIFRLICLNHILTWD